MARKKRKFHRTIKGKKTAIRSSFDKVKVKEPKIKVEPKRVTRKIIRPRVQYREIVYVGTANKSTVVGKVTGKKYTFLKNAYNMPKPTKVNESDCLGILAIKGKGCARRNPEALFMSKLDWDLESKG